MNEEYGSEGSGAISKSRNGLVPNANGPSVGVTISPLEGCGARSGPLGKLVGNRDLYVRSAIRNSLGLPELLWYHLRRRVSRC